MSLPLVAIIGRPNIGKSTLFNCFANSAKAIVSDISGTTRDTLMEKIQGETVDYWLLDTAGLRNEKDEDLEEENSNTSPIGSRKCGLNPLYD
jgi:GTP-binding protein